MQERSRMEAETALLEVIPPDTRARVSVADTTGLPHRWICRLRVPDADPRSRSYGMGTGVLVGPRHVLTSAHVLVSDPGRTVGGRLLVQPARNGDFKPFKEVKIRGWRVDPRWIARNQRGRWQVQTRFDYGLVTLAEDVGSFKHPGLSQEERFFVTVRRAYWAAPDICFPQTEIGIEPHKIVGQQAWSAGYPGDREPGTLHGGTGRVTIDQRLGTLLHTIDTHYGQSGSPIWIKRHGMWCLVGIHSRVGGFTVPARGPMVPNSNAAALVSLDVALQIEEWKRAGR